MNNHIIILSDTEYQELKGILHFAQEMSVEELSFYEENDWEESLEFEEERLESIEKLMEKLS